MKTLLVICLCLYSVAAKFSDTIEKKQSGSAGANEGDVMIQRITTAYHWINYLFYWEEQARLISCDKETATSHAWNYDDGKIHSLYHKELEGESLSFNIPAKEKNIRIIASDQNIRILTVTDDLKEKNFSEPVIQLKDKGYCIHTGHCDEEGTLYLISSYKLQCHDKSKGSILYKVKHKAAEKVEQFETKVDDFVFSMDYKKMFVICDAGKIIAEYDFDMDNGKISNRKQVFNVTEVDEGRGCCMTSIEIDNKDNFWVATDDKVVMRVSSDGKLTKLITTPFDSLTAITWGGHQSQDLLVASRKQCSKETQAGSLLLISGLTTVGAPDQLVKW